MEELTNKVRIAKKSHVCDVCGAKIEAGEPYWYHVFIADGEFYTTKEHIECHEAANIVLDKNEYTSEDEVTYSDIQDMLVETCSELMGDIKGVPLKELAKRLYLWDMGQALLEDCDA